MQFPWLRNVARAHRWGCRDGPLLGLRGIGEHCLGKLRLCSFCWLTRTRIELGEGPHAGEMGLPELATRQDHMAALVIYRHTGSRSPAVLQALPRLEDENVFRARKRSLLSCACGGSPSLERDWITALCAARGPSYAAHALCWVPHIRNA